MEENLAQNAIKAALNCKWVEAIKINLKIIAEDNQDIEALNRLSRAYFENGNIDKAKSTSRKVLKINPSNNIAKNSLEKYIKNKRSKMSRTKIDSTSFIEEPGRTKLTTLINLGSEDVYSCLDSGNEVLLVNHAHKISVTTINNIYIGKLTDDLSARLRILIKTGKKFKVFIMSVNKNQVKVFIKGDALSFPLEISESFDEFSA